MKNEKLQTRIHEAMINALKNDFIDHEEKMEMAESVMMSQAGLEKMISDGSLTKEDCDNIEAEIEMFIATNRLLTMENRLLTSSILMLIFGLEIAAKSKGQPELSFENLTPSQQKYGNEQVLVVTRSWLEHVFGDIPQGYFTAVSSGLKAILEEAHFMPRHLMEEDPTNKQLIPYLIIIDENYKVLSYMRGKAGVEDRIHAKLSFGFGGHVNPQDGATLDDPSSNSKRLLDPSMTIERCIDRELEEEIGLKLNLSNMKPKLIGYVNNEADAVGQVHLGLVFLIQVDNDQVDLNKAEQSVVEPQWLDSATFLTGGSNHPRLEEWSRIIADPIFGDKIRRQRASDDGVFPNQEH